MVTPSGAAPVRARAIVLAHGLRYDPPPLPGIEPLWGRSVFHCAFCDGWEVRDRPLSLHASGPGAVRSALLLAGWSDDVLLCTDGAPDPGGELLAAAGVRVRTEPIARLAGAGGRLERIEFSHGPAERREALFVNTRRDQPNGLAAALGCDLTESGTIVADADGRTNVPGVYAAGDAATAHSRSVANAIGTGSRVAYAVALDRIARARRNARRLRRRVRAAAGPRLRAKETTCSASRSSRHSTTASSTPPSAPKTRSEVSTATPSGVGQPRSACVTARRAESVAAPACGPPATAMQPTARPSR